MKLLQQIIAPLLSVAVLVVSRNTINVYLMGFFRDVGRIKARNRRMKNNENGVIASDGGSINNWDILLRRDDPLAGVNFNDLDHDDVPTTDTTTATTTFTVSELYEFGNGQNGQPILLSVFGRVYDVTAGSKFYGEGGSYSMFAGRDVTRALCMGCKTEECLVRNTDGLTEKQLAEGKRWLSFFQLHDKYSYVGDLEGDREGWLDALIETHIISETSVGEDEKDDEEHDVDLLDENEKERATV